MSEDYPAKIVVEAHDALWRSVMAPLFDARPVDGRPLQGMVESRILGRTLIGYSRYGGHLCVRDAALVNRGGIDQILLQIVLSGEFRGRFGDASLRASAGDVVIMDYSRPFELLVSDGSTISFGFDRILISRFVEPRSMHGLVVRGDTSLGKILTSLVTTALGIADSDQFADKFALESDILEIMARQLSRDVEGVSLSAELQSQTIVDFIDRNLFDHALSPALIQARFGLSRSNLYRLFDAYGGVRKLIWERRLKAAYQEIMQAPPHRKLSMKALSYKFGCADAAQFRKQFTRYFSRRPEEIVRSKAESAFMSGSLMDIQRHFGKARSS